MPQVLIPLGAAIGSVDCTLVGALPVTSNDGDASYLRLNDNVASASLASFHVPALDIPVGTSSVNVHAMIVAKAETGVFPAVVNLTLNDPLLWYGAAVNVTTDYTVQTTFTQTFSDPPQTTFFNDLRAGSLIAQLAGGRFGGPGDPQVPVRVTYAALIITWGIFPDDLPPPLRQRQRGTGLAGASGPPLRQFSGAAAPRARQNA